MFLHELPRKFLLIFMNILIVEYDKTTISDLKAILAKLGHNVVKLASSGEEAIHDAGDLNPDLIMINIKLKGQMNGVEAAIKISNLYKIPVIFLSVFIKNCLNKSLQLPENAVVLSKPIKYDHLKYSISRVLSVNE
jgi:two-component system, response regulator PdtaR